MEAKGGTYSLAGRKAKNTYGALTRQSGETIRFYLRSASVPWFDDSIPWTQADPGADLSTFACKRFLQAKAVFYPSGDAEGSPYLEELRIIYRPDPAPKPPSMLIARARDGAVDLSWRISPDLDVSGYLVYYGLASGVYYGDASPIDAGKTTSYRVEGLQNGLLYFFAIAAYDHKDDSSWHSGAFSEEQSARPGL
jgi:hypothetical protein